MAEASGTHHTVPWGPPVGSRPDSGRGSGTVSGTSVPGGETSVPGDWVVYPGVDVVAESSYGVIDEFTVKFPSWFNSTLEL